MVIDTSALVAVLRNEPERESFLARIVAAPLRLVSAVSWVEAGILMEARYGADGGADLDLFLAAAAVQIVAFDGSQAELARRAWRKFGKGRHSAGLNFGDCCSYALARARTQPLLFNGNDFARTDVLTVQGLG